MSETPQDPTVPDDAAQPTDPNAPEATQPIVVDPADPDAPPVATQLPADVTPTDPSTTDPTAPPPDATVPADTTEPAPDVPPAAPDEAPPVADTGAPPESSDSGATPAEGDSGTEVVVPGTPTTPASDLPAAPPMTDESGSNIPPQNQTQPITGDIPSQTVPAESFDPALVDPDQAAADAAEGTVSDATVPPEEGAAKGDVETATVPEGSGEGEYLYPLTIENIVVLGHHEAVPARLQGLRANVIDAPRYLIPIGRRDEVWIRVKIGNPFYTELSVPLAAVDSVE